MERIKDFLDEQLGQIILSNSRRKEEVSKVRVRPLLLQEKLVFQVEEFRGKQAFHQKHQFFLQKKRSHTNLGDLFLSAGIAENDQMCIRDSRML